MKKKPIKISGWGLWNILDAASVDVNGQKLYDMGNLYNPKVFKRAAKALTQHFKPR